MTFQHKLLFLQDMLGQPIGFLNLLKFMVN